MELFVNCTYAVDAKMAYQRSLLRKVCFMRARLPAAVYFLSTNAVNSFSLLSQRWHVSISNGIWAGRFLLTKWQKDLHRMYNQLRFGWTATQVWIGSTDAFSIQSRPISDLTRT